MGVVPGIVDAAASREVSLRRAGVPWNVREAQIDVAAALSRYVVQTYGRDDLKRLDRTVVNRVWQAECDRYGGVDAAQLCGLATRTEFLRAARDLVRYAVGRGWLATVSPDMVGIERMTILTTTVPSTAVDLGPPAVVMLHDLDGTPLGMVNVYAWGTTGRGDEAS